MKGLFQFIIPGYNLSLQRSHGNGSPRKLDTSQPWSGAKSNECEHAWCSLVTVYPHTVQNPNPKAILPTFRLALLKSTNNQDIPLQTRPQPRHFPPDTPTTKTSPYRHAHNQDIHLQTRPRPRHPSLDTPTIKAAPYTHTHLGLR